jgi:mannose-6-phosphate isomerase-like protein (cupin superfamily)
VAVLIGRPATPAADYYLVSESRNGDLNYLSGRPGGVGALAGTLAHLTVMPKTYTSLRFTPVSYSKKNLRDVQDMAVQHGLSTTQEARFPREDLGAEQTGINYLTVKPGQREAFAHRHRTAEEIYVVLGGSGSVKLDDELVELAPLDAVRVSPGTARSFEAGPDSLEVLVFGPHVEADGEMVQDFWDE